MICHSVRRRRRALKVGSISSRYRLPITVDAVSSRRTRRRTGEGSNAIPDIYSKEGKEMCDWSGPDAR